MIFFLELELEVVPMFVLVARTNVEMSDVSIKESVLVKCSFALANGSSFNFNRCLHDDIMFWTIKSET